MAGCGLDASTATDQIHEYHDNGNNEQDVNKAPDRIRGHQSQRPKNKQDYSNRPQHSFLPFARTVLRCQALTYRQKPLALPI